MTRVTRREQLFPESQDCDAAQSTWRIPQGTPHWTCPSAISQRHVCMAPSWQFITCKVFFLSSSVNIIKASAYYRFHCPRGWSLLTVQIRQDCWMWIRLKLKQAGDNEKGWLESPYQLKRVLRYAEHEDYTQFSVQSQEVELLLLQTLQASLHWHRRVPLTPGGKILYRKAPSGIVCLSSPKLPVIGRLRIPVIQGYFHCK